MPHHLAPQLLQLPLPRARRLILGRSSPWGRLRAFLGEHDSQMVESLLAVALLAYGVWIALPWFDSLATGVSYQYLRRLPGGETTLGGLLCLLGGQHLWSVLRGGLRWRALASWLALATWGFLALFLWLGSGGASPGAAVFAALAAYSAICYWRLRDRLRWARQWKQFPRS